MNQMENGSFFKKLKSFFYNRKLKSPFLANNLQSKQFIVQNVIFNILEGGFGNPKNF